jgi:tyrosyl-tRNA synthetase
MSSDLFDTLEARGYIYQSTNLEGVKKLFQSSEKFTFYLGIDPTADSLHIGHFFALMMFRYLQDAGHRGLLLIGGATALVGDPSGKSDMRKILTREQVEHNLTEVAEVAKRFVRTDGENPAIILNNADWINSYSYVDFMRLVGIHFNVNTMLAADAYANRLKQGGLTFLEMGYMLMQAFDFVHLNHEYGCVLQIGGSDQWGNIVAGTSLSRKMHFLNKEQNDETEIFGLTCPLLLTRDGKKMGKTESGTLWVAREKTTAYDFYQYFYNVDDTDAEMLLKLFTHVPLDEIQSLCETDIIAAKRVMAYEITKLVHGQEEAERAAGAAKAVFGGGVSHADMPTTVLTVSDLTDGAIAVVDVLLKTKLAPSKGEGRRLIEQGGLSVNEEKVTDVYAVIAKEPLENGGVIIKKGKKVFHKVTL